MKTAHPNSSRTSLYFILSISLLVATTHADSPPNDDHGASSHSPSPPPPTATPWSSGETLITSPQDAIILNHLSRNLNASSATLEVVTKKWEDDLRVRRERMRNDWKRAFDEIREGRILMSKLDEMPGEKEEGRLLDRWKEFLDAGATGGANAVTNGEVTGDEDEDTESGPDESANLDESDATKQIMKKKSPLRFDGFQTWEKQLQQWSDEVSAYLSETEVQWSELLKSKESSGYELGKFGLSSQGLKDLTKSARRDKFERADDSGKDENVPSSKVTSTLQRFRLDTTTTPIGTLPIALTALEPNLPKLPKPRPVTSSDTIVPHTDIADLTKNIWIVTTASLPWMTGTAVNPLLRAAYLTAGRKQVGGSVTLMLPWVERPADQERIYGKAERFANQKEQEEYVRDWLRDVADLKEASVDLRIRWYTAWQEVAENSLYSMGDIIGLIPEEECDICVLEEPEHLS